MLWPIKCAQHANLPMEMWYDLYGKIFTTVALLDGLTVIEINGKHVSQYEHFFGEMPRFVCSLHTVGEVGTIKIKTDTTPKLEDWGIHCMFVRYFLMHPTECYRMYDPKTHRVHLSCNVVWLHQMFYQKNSKEMVMGQITVGNWFRNPQGMSRFIEVGEGISEASCEENYNTVDTPIIENDMEEQATEEIQENQEQATTPSTNASGRASQPPAHLIEEMGEAALTTAE